MAPLPNRFTLGSIFSGWTRSAQRAAAVPSLPLQPGDLEAQAGRSRSEGAGEPKRKLLPQLHGIRFLAAFCVMLSHSAFATTANDVPGSLLAIIGGAAGMGMSLFFTLSGFVIHYSYRDEIPRSGGGLRYGLARFARLYPLYFVLLVYYVIASDMVPGMLDGDYKTSIAFLFSSSLTQAWWHGTIGQNNLVYYFGFLPLQVAWSISTEIFLYFLFPILCLGLLRIRSFTINLVLVAAIAVIQIAWCPLVVFNADSLLAWYQSIFGRIVFEGTISSRAIDFTLGWLQAFGPVARFWQFAFGCALANLYMLRGTRNLTRLKIWPGVALLGLLGFHWVNSVVGVMARPDWVGHYVAASSYMATQAMLSVLGGWLIYACASNPDSRTSRIFGSRLMVMGGDASYSSYLLHLAMFSYINLNFFPLVFRARFDLDGAVHAIYLLTAYALVLGISYCLYMLYESPMRKLIRKHVNPGAIIYIVALQMTLFLAGVYFCSRLQWAATP